MEKAKTNRNCLNRMPPRFAFAGEQPKAGHSQNLQDYQTDIEAHLQTLYQVSVILIYQNKVKDEFTYKIIGCAMKVHNMLGNGFQEVIYQRSLAIELGNAGLYFEREKEQNIYYKGIEIGTRRADFIVENKVIVELKALIALEEVHLAQAKNYLEAYKFPIGLLINFGSKSLEYKFIFNKKIIA